MTKRQIKTIENENSVNFNINIDSEFKSYDIVLLSDGPDKHFYNGSPFSSSSSVIVDTSKICAAKCLDRGKARGTEELSICDTTVV